MRLLLVCGLFVGVYYVLRTGWRHGPALMLDWTWHDDGSYDLYDRVMGTILSVLFAIVTVLIVSVILWGIWQLLWWAL